MMGDNGEAGCCNVLVREIRVGGDDTTNRIGWIYEKGSQGSKPGEIESCFKITCIKLIICPSACKNVE